MPGYIAGASLVFLKVFDDLGTPLLLDVNTSIDFGSSIVNSNTIFTTIKKNGYLMNFKY